MTQLDFRSFIRCTSKEFRWREKDLDNALMTELASDSPLEARIRELVAQGADVNSVAHDESVLIQAISFILDRSDERLVHLLVQLGADVNYLTPDGDNPPLWAACHVSPTVVEYLLQQGAEPNVVCDFSHTVLDWTEIDLGYHKTEAAGDMESEHGKWCRKLEEIITVLRQYGAKRLREYRTPHVSHWLQMFGCNDTGLLTSGGYVEVDAIDGLTESFRADFKAWKDAFWDTWPDKDWSTKPPEFDRIQHNDWGRRLTKGLRAILPREISIQYLSPNADYEQTKIRSVDHENIE